MPGWKFQVDSSRFHPGHSGVVIEIEVTTRGDDFHSLEVPTTIDQLKNGIQSSGLQI